jgi:hypothetical protein
VDHTALIMLSKLVLSKASPFASFQLHPAFCNSHSISLFQFILDLPLFLLAWGFYTNASHYCTLPVTYRMTNPTPFSFLIFCSIGVCSIICHNSSFEILSGRLTFKISRRHRFTNTESDPAN